MKTLQVFLKWDGILLYRNRLFHIALLIAVIYTGLFLLLKPLGNLDNILVVLIFNDPVVTGYIFGGVIWLFDKNQHTLPAVSVLPVRHHLYLLSKILLLSGLAVMVSVVMALAAGGVHLNWFHLVFSVFLTTFLFSAAGFTLASLSSGFNQFLLFSIPFFIISAIPFLPLFGIGRVLYFIFLPTMGSVVILKASMGSPNGWYLIAMYVHLIFWTTLSWLLVVRITQKRMA